MKLLLRLTVLVLSLGLVLEWMPDATAATAASPAKPKAGDARVGYTWNAPDGRVLKIGLDSTAPIKITISDRPNGVTLVESANPFSAAMAGEDYTYQAVFRGVPDGIYRVEIPDQGRTFTAYLEVKASNSGEGHLSLDAPRGLLSYTLLPAVKPGGTQVSTPAKIIMGKGIPGFFMPEIYKRGGEYWVRDTVAKYTDDRTRYFWVDRDFVSQDTLDYRLGNRAGIYVFEVFRYRGEYWRPESGIESHRVELMIPGAMDEPGEIATPATFIPHENFIDRHTEMLPPYAPISGKFSIGIRYSQKYTTEDMYKHGAGYGGMHSGEHDPAKLSITDGEPYAPLSEEKFQQIPDEELRATAKTRGGMAFYQTDFEFWTIGLRDEKTLRKMYTYASALREFHPGTRLADCYRHIVWNKSFRVADEPRPLDPKFLEQYKNPESAVSESFRKFKTDDGKTVSMRDVYNFEPIDCYSIWSIQPGREHAVYHLYSMIHDTRLVRKLTPSGTKALFFCWPGNDGDIPFKLYHKTSKGWVWQTVRKYTSYPWMETTAMLSFIIGDGYHPWHDNPPCVDDPDAVNSVDYKGDNPNLEGWEPDEKGAPSPIKRDLIMKSYPREPQWYSEYAKLGEYKVKQIDDILAGGFFGDAEYSIDGGKTWLNTEGETAILYRAAGKQPIVLKKVSGGKAAVFAVNPFAKGNPRVAIQVKLSNLKTVTVTMTGKWPTLQRFAY